MKFNFYFLDFPETRALFTVLEKHGIEARFVGGCVRDGLLGMTTDDLDLAVNSDIESVKKILEANGIGCLDTGIKYGSITVFVDKRKFEITSLRIDEECFGRDCTILETSDFEEDARRRDFTINAIYSSRSGEICDYFGGIEDLRNKCVRFIGDPTERIQEDALRIFRYYRMCAKFGDLSNRYHEILKNRADDVRKISIERIQKELFIILMSDYSFEIIRFMIEVGILHRIFPSINENKLHEITRSNLSIEGRLYLLFDTTESLKTLKLTRKYKSKIMEYKKFEGETPLYILYKKGSDFLSEMREINRIKNGIDMPEPDISSDQFPKFPVTFADLPPGTKDAQKKLNECEKWWANTEFQKNKDACMEYIERLDCRNDWNK
ncbi:MAG: CCA tRNA nucleotidyltransferase [Holosporales bacterium]|nr:CCA tRNA nucleotidyltransferase [Holosporales bacterium]